jgi:ribonuclease T2
VLQYAPALCTDGTFSCPTKASWTYFTLHGLWPERSDGTYPQTCSNQKYDPSAVSSILPRLEKFWVSLNGPSQTFWAHEYEKHGTCAEDVFPDQLAFMNGTLAIRDRFDLTPALAAAGIMPSATKGFSPAALQAAATAAFGFPVLPSCDKEGNIDGVVVCVSKQGAAQSCGSVKYGSCAANTLYLLPAEQAAARGGAAGGGDGVKAKQ